MTPFPKAGLALKLCAATNSVKSFNPQTSGCASESRNFDRLPRRDASLTILPSKSNAPYSTIADMKPDAASDESSPFSPTGAVAPRHREDRRRRSRRGSRSPAPEARPTHGAMATNASISHQSAPSDPKHNWRQMA